MQQAVLSWHDAGLICLLLIAGGISAWNDLKRNIVPNKVVAATLACAMTLHAVGILVDGTGSLLSWLLNWLIGSALAVLMYAAGIWAAGDVKLFAALFACVPFTLLEETASESIPFYFLIFSVAFVYLIGDTLRKSIAHTESFHAAHFAWRQLIDVVLLSVEVTTLQMAGTWIAPVFCEENPMLVSVLAMIAAYIYSEKGLVRVLPFLLANLALLIIAFFAGQWSMGAPDLRIYLAVALIILFRNKASQYNYQRIPTGEVSKGMILAAPSVMTFAVSRVQGLPQNASEGMDARLSESEAAAVRRWEHSAHGQPTVVIVRKIPFAGFIYIGFVLWFAIKGVQSLL